MNTYEGFSNQDELVFSGIEFHNYVCKYLNDVVMCSDERVKDLSDSTPRNILETQDDVAKGNKS